MGTLLALGSAATSASTIAAKGSIGSPAAAARPPAASSTSGWTTSLCATRASTAEVSPGRAMAASPDGPRASIAPSAKSATGDAAAARYSTACIAGPGSCQPVAAEVVPSAIDHGSGLPSMPRSARPTATRASPPACPSCDMAMHSEVVTTMSRASATMAGAAAAGPSSATSSGTPMNPLLGNALTSAAKAASPQRSARRRAQSTVSATITAAPAR